MGIWTDSGHGHLQTMDSTIMTEAQFTAIVKKYLNSIDCWWFKVAGGPFQRAGIPDIIGVRRGTLFALELKGRGGRASPLQERCVRLISECGGYAKIVYPEDWGEIVEWFER